MDKINKILDFDIKQMGEEEDRVLRFCGSDETPDRDNDIMEVGGWKLDDYVKNPVFLWAHSYHEPPIGKAINVMIDAAAKKLIFDVKFPTAEEYPFADTVYKLYKGGYLKATSVGFQGVKFKARDEPEVLDMPEWRRGRRYMEQTLLELSAVPVPSNPNALMMAKSAGIETDEVERLFKNTQIEKTADTQGNPSTYDIEREIQNAINPNYVMPSVCVNELYPINYPSGNVIIRRQSKYFQHEYIYEKTEDIVKITLNEGIEVQMGYKEKAFDYISQKSGAALSGKNKKMLDEIHKQLADCGDTLRKFIDSAGMMEDEETEPPKSENPELIEIKQALEDIKSQVLLLSPKPDASKEINLDAIEITSKSEIELNIEPETLQRFIKKTIQDVVNQSIQSKLGN